MYGIGKQFADAGYDEKDTFSFYGGGFKKGEIPPTISFCSEFLLRAASKMESSIKVPKKKGAAAGGKKRSADDDASAVPGNAMLAGDTGRAKKAKKTGSTRSGGKSSSPAANNNNAKSKAGPSADDVSKLLHWLSREKLEDLITSSVTTSTALSASYLKNALPAEARWRFSSASSPGILKAAKSN